MWNEREIPRESREEQFEHKVKGAELARVLQGYLSEETCAELAEMDLPDALGYTFGALLEEGFEDPEALLIELGILE